MKRREAREKILQILFQVDLTKVDIEQAILDMMENFKMNENDLSFIKNSVNGTYQYVEEIDKLVSKHLQGWTLNRLAYIDRSILRFATYELLYVKDTTVGVILNEAVELAKRFSTDESSKFINGVLAAIAKEIGKQPVEKS